MSLGCHAQALRGVTPRCLVPTCAAPRKVRRPALGTPSSLLPSISWGRVSLPANRCLNVLTEPTALCRHQVCDGGHLMAEFLGSHSFPPILCAPSDGVEANAEPGSPPKRHETTAESTLLPQQVRRIPPPLPAKAVLGQNPPVKVQFLNTLKPGGVARYSEAARRFSSLPQLVGSPCCLAAGGGAATRGRGKAARGAGRAATGRFSSYLSASRFFGSLTMPSGFRGHAQTSSITRAETRHRTARRSSKGMGRDCRHRLRTWCSEQMGGHRFSRRLVGREPLPG